LGKFIEGDIGELLPVPTKIMVVEHIDDDATEAASPGLEMLATAAPHGVRIGEGIDAAVQGDSLSDHRRKILVLIDWASDEITQISTGQGVWPRRGKVKVGEKVHEEGLTREPRAIP
jgi:hypothetical protein